MEDLIDAVTITSLVTSTVIVLERIKDQTARDLLTGSRLQDLRLRLLLTAKQTNCRVHNVPEAPRSNQISHDAVDFRYSHSFSSL